jgi:hypothetical protein
VALRTGTRVLDPRPALRFLGRDFGEDWVVPKAEVRYLVARTVAASILLTAFGREGQVLGERLFPDAAEAAAVMERMRDEKVVEGWREIPEDEVSAARFLETGLAAS